MSTGPTLGLAEAARACGVSPSTVRRRRDALEALGATVSPAGWVIPITALFGVGLMPRVTPPDTPSSLVVTPGTTPPGDIPEVIELRQALTLERTRREAAEMLAAAERRRADDLAQALRLLEPARPSPALVPVDVDQPAASTRRGWWRRRS